MKQEITPQQIVEIRTSVKEIVQNAEVVNALAQTTFQDLEPANIPKALLEGMIRGYTLSDFLTKKIYAIPFKDNQRNVQTYSLVNSISDVRSTATRAGQSGKSEPRYEFDEGGKVISCSVTVWKRGGDDRGYTAKVYFSEYTTGKNQWAKRPLTMIAKVAEMHALRMAFPDELGQVYVEEEFDREKNSRDFQERFRDIDPQDMTLKSDAENNQEEESLEGVAEGNEEKKQS